MKKMTQAQMNPFPHSDSNKRYHTYDYYLRHKFGCKVAKLTLNGGFGCPNRDGTCGTRGCIFCSGEGSGEFSASAQLSVAEQIQIQKEKLSPKWKAEKYIAYFQPFTNTYAPVSRLRQLYDPVPDMPDIVGINIATRADCLGDDVVDYLAELSERTVLTVELGLQSVHDDTALAIGRGHDFSTFLKGYERLRQKAPLVRLGVHLIFGLIGENDERMLQSVQRVAELLPDEVKIHLLYVLKNTKMGEMYTNGCYLPMEMTEYVSLVVRALEQFAPETVIGRLTGDGAGDALLAPLWSRKKGIVLNEIDKTFYEQNTFQGKFFKKV